MTTIILVRDHTEIRPAVIRAVGLRNAVQGVCLTERLLTFNDRRRSAHAAAARAECRTALRSAASATKRRMTCAAVHSVPSISSSKHSAKFRSKLTVTRVFIGSSIAITCCRTGRAKCRSLHHAPEGAPSGFGGQRTYSPDFRKCSARNDSTAELLSTRRQPAPGSVDRRCLRR